MKKIVFTLIISLLASFLFAQEDSTSQVKKKQKDPNEIQTLSGNVSHNGFFIAPTLKVGPIRNETSLFMALRLGWTINRVLALGVEGTGLIPTSVSENIIPATKTRVLMGYGGFFLEPIFFSNKLIHFTLPISWGAGWAGYVRDWNNQGTVTNTTNEPIDQQVFWYIEPALNLELNVSRHLRFSVGGSYRFIKDMKLLNTSASDFNGMNYTFGIKLGNF
jgi:hypothetical protein